MIRFLASESENLSLVCNWVVDFFFLLLQVGDISSDFKLDAVKGHGSEDPEVGSINGGVHLILPERRGCDID